MKIDEQTMTITAPCPTCGHVFEVKKEDYGKTLRCPKCKTHSTFMVTDNRKKKAG